MARDRTTFGGGAVFLLLLLGALTGCHVLGGGPEEPTQRVAHFESGDVSYEVHGAGPPLVLIHGWASDRRAWFKNIVGLSEEFRVIVIDLPGHGESAEPRVDYSMNLFADGIASVLDAEGVADAILVGHSNGVPTVRQFYRRHRDRVRGLVLVDGALMNIVPAEMREQFLGVFRGEEYQASVEQMVAGMPSPILTSEDRVYLTSMALAQPQHAVAGGFEAVTDPSIWTEDTIDAPCLMIMAEQPIWNDAYEAKVRELVPNVDYRMLSNTGHFIMVERPEEFSGWVREFADRLANELGRD